jgi:hypothetical protein
VPPATSPSGYLDVGDGTVTDGTTNLMWEQVVSTTSLTWSAAQQYCATLTLGGHADWRLPTKIELVSIVDFGIAAPGPTLDTTAFPLTLVGYYWSATPDATSPTNMWSVNFYNAYTSVSATSNALHTRCVR